MTISQIHIRYALEKVTSKIFSCEKNKIYQYATATNSESPKPKSLPYLILIKLNGNVTIVKHKQAKDKTYFLCHSAV